MNFDPDALDLGVPRLRARKVSIIGDAEWCMEKKVKGRWAFTRWPTEEDMVLIAAALFREGARP